MLALTSWKPVPLDLDGHPVTIEIKRLTVHESEAYRRQLDWLIEGREERKPTSWEDAAQADEQMSRFATTAIAAYVRVPAGQITLDGEPVASGAALVQAFGGAPSVVFALLLAVAYHNEVSPAAKKAWRSLYGFGASSPQSTATPDGDAPEPTADAADPKDSTTSAAATAETSSSGPTAILS